MAPKKVKGTHGSWFASVDGELLPCVHDYYWSAGARYNDHDMQATPQATELLDAIREKKRVILTKDKPTQHEFGRMSFQRKDYVAVFSVGDVEFDQEGLRFKFIKGLPLNPLRVRQPGSAFLHLRQCR